MSENVTVPREKLLALRAEVHEVIKKIEKLEEKVTGEASPISQTSPKPPLRGSVDG